MPHTRPRDLPVGGGGRWAVAGHRSAYDEPTTCIERNPAFALTPGTDARQLHAAFWDDSRYAAVPWLAPRMAAMVNGDRADQIRKNFDGPIGAGVPPEVRDPQRLTDTHRTLVDLEATARPWCVIHGDPDDWSVQGCAPRAWLRIERDEG